MSGCGDKDPVSSGNESTPPAAKLTISGSKAGGAPYRLASRGTLAGASSASGLTVSSGPAGGQPDRVALLTLGTPDINVNGTVTIDGSVVAVEEGTSIDRLEWSWGDGTSEVLSFPVTHTYAKTGNYTVTVTAFNNKGASQGTALNIEVPEDDRIEVLTLSPPAVDGLDVTINGVVLPVEGGPEIVQIEWVWGDGTETESFFEASHTYADFGTYTVTVTTINEEGGSRSATTEVVAADPADVVLTFSDANLEAAIRDEIGKQTGDITSADVTNLTRLSANSKNISNLSGIENLTALTELFLASNQITDISALSGLTEISSLDLWVNQITDISPLANLTRLNSLSIHTNQITDISALQNLTLLDRLLVGANQISDISVVTGLTALQTLGINSTLVTDLTPVVNNTGIGSGDEVDVRDTSLSADATSTQIPALEARGVTVTQ
jgi:PKD repeat protein